MLEGEQVEGSIAPALDQSPSPGKRMERLYSADNFVRDLRNAAEKQPTGENEAEFNNVLNEINQVEHLGEVLQHFSFEQRE